MTHFRVLRQRSTPKREIEKEDLFKGFVRGRQAFRQLGRDPHRDPSPLPSWDGPKLDIVRFHRPTCATAEPGGILTSPEAF